MNPIAAQTYSNPLYTPAFPPAGGWFTDGPADPVIVEFEGRYYVYPTGNGFTYKVMYSDDLVHWSGDAVAFHMPSDSPWKSSMLWAPEIERINGRFYLYYTAGLGGFNQQRIGVADADTPLGPFVDQSFAAPLISEAAIDAECFVDEDELYLYYVRHEDDPFELSIWVRKLLDPLTPDPASTPVLCIEPTLGWEAAVTEGPTVIQRGDRYYMFYSAWGASSPNYCVAVGVADHPLGPWVRQSEPYNPVLKRNDAIELWGPGHGHNVIGPDGISDWYIYHHKMNPDENFDRHLALDRIIPVARHESTGLHFTSSGGTTLPTPAPRMPFEHTNFDDNQLPSSFSPIGGVWNATNQKLSAPANGVLEIARDLAPDSLQDFQWQWWLRAATGFVPTGASSFEFSFPTTKQGVSHRIGWKIWPANQAVVFVEVNEDTGATVIHAHAALNPPVDWAHHSRQITLTRNGSLWRFLMDGKAIASVQHHATLGPEAWIRTTNMPAWLDGYRQTVAFVEDFECFSCTSDRWDVLGGTWSYVSPAAEDDGHLRQSDRMSGHKLAIYGNLSPGEFDLSADFMPVAPTDGYYGLVHNLADVNHYALVVIDDHRSTVRTNAVIGGVLQDWVDSSVPMPPTFAVADYRNLAVTTDADAGEFVYSLNGLEVLRRSHPGLPVRGRAGLFTESSDVRIDNFRFTDSTARPRIVLDPPFIQRSVYMGDPIAADAFTITNGGADGLTYQIACDASWVEIWPLDGNSTGETDEISMEYNLAGLSAGTHTAQITVESTEAFNSPQVLTVQLVIETVLPDFDGDGDVDMDDFSHMQRCLTPTTSPPAVPPECEDAEMTGDERIDLNDIRILQDCLSGTGILADRDCAGP